MYLKLYFLVLVPYLYQSPDWICCSKLLFKIVVIVTVSFLNLFLPFNVVSHWYHASLYACLDVHMMRIHCLMAMFAIQNVLWIQPSNSSSNPSKATMDPRVRRVQNALQGP